MQHPDEGTIHAWIDGELSPEDSTALEAHIKECAECSAKVAEARGLVAASSRIVSALDIVPGGVIPAAKQKRRAWYARTQLRAAAAVAIVAGASLVVMRSGGTAKMESAIQDSAPATVAAPVITETQVTAPTAADASAPATPPPAPSRKKAEAKFDAVRPRGAQPSAVEAADEGSLRRKAAADTASVLSLKVAGGVAAAPMMAAAAAPELKKIRTDSTANVKRTIYEADSGVQVTLIDEGPTRVSGGRAAGVERQMAQRSAASAPPPPAATGAAVANEAVVSTIRWVDRRGHSMILRGSVPTAELERIRQRLPEDQR